MISDLKIAKEAAEGAKRHMILVFDVGNTNIVIGIFKGEELVTNWRTATDRRRTADDLGMLLKNLFDYSRLLFQRDRGYRVVFGGAPADPDHRHHVPPLF